MSTELWPLEGAVKKNDLEKADRQDAEAAGRTQARVRAVYRKMPVATHAGKRCCRNRPVTAGNATTAKPPEMNYFRVIRRPGQ